MFKSKKICTWKIKNAQNHLKCLGKWFLGNFEKYEICVDSMDSERDGDWLTMSTHQPSIRSKNDSSRGASKREAAKSSNIQGW